MIKFSERGRSRFRRAAGPGQTGLSHQIGAYPHGLAPLCRQVPVQSAVHHAKSRNDEQREADEIESKDRVRHKRVECLVGEIAGVIQRIAPLLPGREARKEHQRCGVEQKDRLIRVGGPGQPERGGPDDLAEPGPSGEPVDQEEETGGKKKKSTP